MAMTILPELTLAVFGVLVLMAGLHPTIRRYAGEMALAGVALALLSLLYYLGQGMDAVAGETVQMGPLTLPYVTNLFTVVFKAIFLAVGLLVTFASLGYMKDEDSPLEVYYSLILFSLLGMLVVPSAADMVTLFLGMELAAVPGFILVGFEKKRLGLEGAIKYFVFGAFFSVLMVLGIALIYMATGSFLIGDMATPGGGNTMLFLGILLLLSGFGFEMAAVPFHLWAPDAYQGAPSPVAALLAGASKKMALAAALKVLAVAVVLFKLELTLVIAPLALLSMVAGNLMAVAQKDIRRMLAYSSIAQVGYILAGIALLTQTGVAAAIYHIIVHAFMKGGAFIAAGAVATTLSVTRIEDYRGLSKRAPVTAFCMLVFLLSLAGLVPFGGFTSKMLILLAAFNGAFSPDGVALAPLILGIALIATSLLALYYYFRVIKQMYFAEPERDERIHEPYRFIIPMVLAAILTLALFYAPPFLGLCLGVAEGLGF